MIPIGPGRLRPVAERGEPIRLARRVDQIEHPQRYRSVEATWNHIGSHLVAFASHEMRHLPLQLRLPT
jgi:hypothetical protein